MTDPYALAAKLGISIEERETGGKVGNLIIFSEYLPHPPTIVIYKDAVTAKTPAYEERIAHEIFHHRVSTGKVKFVSRAEEEAAAEAFRNERAVL